MEMNRPANGSVHIKLLAATEPPRRRRIYSYLEPTVYDELVELAHSEGLDISTTIRDLISFSLQIYREIKDLSQRERAELPATMQELVLFALHFYRETQEIAQHSGKDIS